MGVGLRAETGTRSTFWRGPQRRSNTMCVTPLGVVSEVTL